MSEENIYVCIKQIKNAGKVFCEAGELFQCRDVDSKPIVALTEFKTKEEVFADMISNGLKNSKGQIIAHTSQDVKSFRLRQFPEEYYDWPAGFKTKIVENVVGRTCEIYFGCDLDFKDVFSRYFVDMKTYRRQTIIDEILDDE